METIVIVLVAFITLAFASLRWGFDSRDGIDGSGWKRRPWGILRQE